MGRRDNATRIANETETQKFKCVPFTTRIHIFQIL